MGFLWVWERRVCVGGKGVGGGGAEMQFPLSGGIGGSEQKCKRTEVSGGVRLYCL